MQLILFAIIFAIIIVVGGGGYFFLSQAEKNKRRSRTLSVIRGESHGPANNAAKSEKDSREKRRAEIAKKLQDAQGENEKKKKGDLKIKLVQAGLPITIRQYYLYSLIFAVVVTVLSYIMGQHPLMCLVIGFVGLFGVPRLVLRMLAKRRQKKFLEDFADALEAMVRLLKAGMPVSEAISMASREFGGPVGEEMARIYEDQKIGTALGEAVLSASRRMPITEMQMFATGIAIQAQTGSSLSEVLTNLARVIRSRFRLKRKVEALSAEAKTSAGIIGALPFLVGGGMYLINPDFISVLFTTTTGKAWLIGSGVWMVLGCLVMRQMINFKV